MNLDERLWVVQEARRVLEKIGNSVPKKGYVLFETGYGPSGLPHIGTFGEVVRTSSVMYAFKKIAPHIPAKLLVLSDDFDGMRKVPDNVPNKEMLKNYISKPLTSVPDPFGTHKSYGDHMNYLLCNFLDNFGFEYDFGSATEYYKSGKFDEYLVRAAEKYDELMNLMLPTLGAERQSTYSPFMPIDPETGNVLTEGVISVDSKRKTILFRDHMGVEKETSFLSGGCKLQWKCDFGMRWAALGVDYEIYGKDHYPNEPLYRSICSILGEEPPVNFFYELFLDADGKKISKSKGNGVDISEWLHYTNAKVLTLYMLQKPKMAKRLYFDIIPKFFDEFIMLLRQHNQVLKDENRLCTLMDFVFRDEPVPEAPSILFSLILNLASACKADHEDILWGFLSKYNPNLSKGKNEILDEMVLAAIRYYDAFILPSKKYHTPSLEEIEMILHLKTRLQELLLDRGVNTQNDLATDAQNIMYDVPKNYNFDEKAWFLLIYRTLLGTEQGPRMGTFVALYGIENTIALIDGAVSRMNNEVTE